jgi:hypothetical protein
VNVSERPDLIQIRLPGLFLCRVLLREHPTSLPPAIASSMSLTELSRATASGMNELGNNTVSRSGRTGTSVGTTYERSTDTCCPRAFWSVMEIPALGTSKHTPMSVYRRNSYFFRRRMLRDGSAGRP